MLTKENISKLSEDVSDLLWDEKDWEKIDVSIHTTQIFIRKIGIEIEGHESICYPVFYEKVQIARLYCSGQIEFMNKENWKEGWKFATHYSEDGNKYVYKRITKKL